MDDVRCGRDVPTGNLRAQIRRPKPRSGQRTGAGPISATAGPAAAEAHLERARQWQRHTDSQAAPHIATATRRADEAARNLDALTPPAREPRPRKQEPLPALVVAFNPRPSWTAAYPDQRTDRRPAFAWPALLSVRLPWPAPPWTLRRTPSPARLPGPSGLPYAP